MYFCEIEKFSYGEINERSFSNPHPWTVIRYRELILLTWINFDPAMDK